MRTQGFDNKDFSDILIEKARRKNEKLTDCSTDFADFFAVKSQQKIQEKFKSRIAQI